MGLSYLVNDERELSNIATMIINYSKSNIFIFYGDMGIGKTTFIKYLCSSLNVIDIVSSPTFSIVNEYKTTEDSSIFHFDFYRTLNKAEIFDIGYEEYIFSSSYCFIEWPEKAHELLPSSFVKVNMFLEDSLRRITVENIN
ncbi:MAG: tRNA (adenosine(37)-N6)-threonylcarbamoyltransferase complex ATPase subunit type 1 TsaE [Flavobacteriales bacterium]